MTRLNDVIKTLVFGAGLIALGSAALAADEVLEVEVFNASAHAITPGDDFSWLEDPDNAGHDFVVAPKSSQELMYYLPVARGAEAFTYRQGEQACHGEPEFRRTAARVRFVVHREFPLVCARKVARTMGEGVACRAHCASSWTIAFTLSVVPAGRRPVNVAIGTGTWPGRWRPPQWCPGWFRWCGGRSRRRWRRRHIRDAG